MADAMAFFVPLDAVPRVGDTFSCAVDGGQAWLVLGTVVETTLVDGDALPVVRVMLRLDEGISFSPPDQAQKS